MLGNVEILIDRAIRARGLLFYGTPWTRRYGSAQAFMDDEAFLERKFDLIPERHVDVLITHCPPYGVCDGAPVIIIGHPGASVTERLGSSALADRVMKVKPRVHVFGHVHLGGHQTSENPTTRFYNAAICNDAYEPVYQPHVIDIEALCPEKPNRH